MIELRLTHPAFDFWVDVRVASKACGPDLALLRVLWPVGPLWECRLSAGGQPCALEPDRGLALFDSAGMC
jgi:hypothetical protein